MKRMIALLLVVLSCSAWADRLSVPNHPKWQEECGSCHLAYPPQLLTADNWQRLMQKLDKHFGANAALEPQEVRDISAFLQHYAGRGSRYSASSLRITDTPWFAREHDEVSSKTWSDPAVKSRANCTACHVRAEQGDWSERSIRVPGGRGGEDEYDDDEDDYEDD